VIRYGSAGRPHSARRQLKSKKRHPRRHLPGDRPKKIVLRLFIPKRPKNLDELSLPMPPMPGWKNSLRQTTGLLLLTAGGQRQNHHDFTPVCATSPNWA